MATSLHQLLDDVADHTERAAGPAALPDAAVALGHAGRALHRLAIDGVDRVNGSPRERMVDELAAACGAAAAPWPPGTGGAGPLTDLIGAAADVVGRLRPLMGPEERWAVAVEISAAADRCAELAHRLLPLAAPREIEAVRQAAAVIEQTAQHHPPALAAAAVLDRQMPWSDVPPGLTGTHVAAEASAALVAAISTAHERDGLTLREFRVVCATALSVSDYAAAFATRLGEDDGQPWRSAAVAWQVLSNTAAVFKDGRWDLPTNGVQSRAAIIPAALTRDLGALHTLDAGALHARPDLPLLLTHLQQSTNQLPVIAEQLHAATRRWAVEGLLRANARDLPPMEDMPEARVRQVMAGAQVQAVGPDLAPLSAAVGRAGSLSTALAAQLNQASLAGPPTQPRLTAWYADRSAGQRATAEIVSDARHVEQALAATRAPFGTGQPHSHSPDR